MLSSNNGSPLLGKPLELLQRAQSFVARLHVIGKQLYPEVSDDAKGDSVHLFLPHLDLWEEMVPDRDARAKTYLLLPPFSWVDRIGWWWEWHEPRFIRVARARLRRPERAGEQVEWVFHFNTQRLSSRQEDYYLETFDPHMVSGCGQRMAVNLINFTRNVTLVNCEACVKSESYLSALAEPVLGDPCRCGADRVVHPPFVQWKECECEAYRSALGYDLREEACKAGRQ
jgi:hypothetical protein